MSETEPDREGEAGESASEPAAEPGPRLRRGLFGYRPDDVHAELDARGTELEELRHDVAALWLAVSQHERTIRHLIAAMEALEREAAAAAAAARAAGAQAGASPSAPPPSTESHPKADAGTARRPEEPREQPAHEAPAVEVPADVIGSQLRDLDDVLAAIEQATRSLERTYADEIAPDTAPPPEAPEAASGDSDGVSRSDPEPR